VVERRGASGVRCKHVPGSFSVELVAGDHWLAIQILADAKFHTLTGNIADIANATEASAPVIPAGTVLFGKFVAIDLHSGRIIAYTA
jgi:hypothetical protein